MDQFTSIIQRYQKEGDVPKMLDAYRRQLLKDKDVSKQVLGANEVSKASDNLLGLISNYEAKGGDMGIMEGKWQDVQEKLGTS